MDMNEADTRLVEAMSNAYTEGTPLGLALATGFFCLLHILIMMLGFILITIVTVVIGYESFLDDITLISYKSLFAWVIGAYAIYLYRTNSTIAQWTERGGIGLFYGLVVLAIVIVVVVGVSLLSKLFGFEIPFSIFG